MKKWLVLCLCFCLLMTGAAFGEAVNGVVVNNHFSLQFEVNEKKSDLILIAEGYKHNTRVPTPLRVEAGRTVTIRPAKGESALLRGRIDIEGEGTVIFEGIRIVAPAGSIGLRIGGGAHVRIDSVTGGEARGNDGESIFHIRLYKDIRSIVHTRVCSIFYHNAPRKSSSRTAIEGLHISRSFGPGRRQLSRIAHFHFLGLATRAGY